MGGRHAGDAVRGVATLVLLLLAAAAWSADGNGTRYYLNLRYAESAPWSRAHDAVGVSIGANLGRYVGLELAGDFYELYVDVPGVGKVGELGTAAVMPQVRLRYPLLEDRLVPYVLGGAGAAFTQFNDRTVFARHRPVHTDEAAFIGAIGGGIEYFFADEIALGVEGRYLLSSEQTVGFEGQRHGFDLDASLLSFSLRVLYPELQPAAKPLAAPGLARFYFGVRAGGAVPLNRHVFGAVEQRPEASAVGPFGQLYGIVLGADLGRRLAIEIPFEGYEMRLHQPGIGNIGEYAVYDFVPQVRVRHPLLRNRLQPYVVGGVGLSYGLFNDKTPTGATVPSIDAEDFGIGATLGAGLEYFVTRNVAVGGEFRYLFARGHSFRFAGSPAVDGDLDSVYLLLGLRIVLFEAGRPM